MKSSTFLAAGFGALLSLATASAGFAQPQYLPAIQEVQVFADCNVGSSTPGPGPFNTAVRFGVVIPGPGLSFTFRNTATGQETNLNTNVLIDNGTFKSYFLLPAGTYVVTARNDPSVPHFVGYSKSFTIKPYTVVTENGKQVCKEFATAGSGGQKTK